jgi:hypothetical protein
MILLTMIGTGWNLFRTGRMTLRREKIRRVSELPGKNAKAMEVR